MDKKKKIQLIIFSAATLIGFIFYLSIGFPLHFFNHFFAGISAGLIVLIVLTSIGIDTDKYEYIVPFLFWLYALIPEFIVIGHEHQENQAHHPDWTNIFLFHEGLDKLLEKSIFTIAITGSITFVLLFLYLKFKKSHSANSILETKK